MERKQIRQGDVLLIPIESPNEEGLFQPLQENQPLQEVRIAGERTGHAHVLPARQILARQAGAMTLLYAYLGAMQVLTHQEHSHVEVPEGWWEIRQQREYLGRRLD